MGQLYKWNCLVMESGWWYAAGTGISISSWTISNSGVTTVNGERWDITIQEGVDVHTLTEKTVPAWDDELLLADSADGYDNKKMTVSNFIQWVIYWDWRDWDCIIDTDSTICAKEYQFKNLTICSWVTLRFCWEWVPIIRVSECFCNLWEIDLYAWHYIKDTTEAHSSTMWTIKWLHNIPWGKVPDVLWWWMGGRFWMSPAYVCDDSCNHNFWRGWDWWWEWESWTQWCRTWIYWCVWKPWWNAWVCSWWWWGWWGFCNDQFPAWCNWCDWWNCIWWNWWNSCWWWGGWWYWYLKGWDWWCSISFTWWNGWDSMYCWWNWGYWLLAWWNWWWWYYCCWGDWWCTSNWDNCWETVETRWVWWWTFYWTPWKWWYPNWKWWMWVFVNWADWISCTTCYYQQVVGCRRNYNWDWWDSIFCSWWKWWDGRVSGYCTTHWWNWGRWRNWWDWGSIPYYGANPEYRTHMRAWNWWDAWWNIYWLGLFINHWYNNCINASGWNWGNAWCVDYWALDSSSMNMDIHWKWIWWNWADWWIVYLISKDFDEWCIDVSWWKGWCWAYSCYCNCYICPEVLNWKDWKDWCIKRFSDWVL